MSNIKLYHVSLGADPLCKNPIHQQHFTFIFAKPTLPFSSHNLNLFQSLFSCKDGPATR